MTHIEYRTDLAMPLKSGELIKVRLVTKDDTARMQTLFSTFSDDTVFHRFQEPIDKLTRERAKRFVEHDPTIVCAVAAYYINDKGQEVFVGVARFGLSGTGQAEYAIVVGDPWQRKGIGTMLMKALALTAHDNGIEWFDCTFDTCNIGFLDFSVATGLKGALNYEDGQLLMRTAVKAILDAPEKRPS